MSVLEPIDRFTRTRWLFKKDFEKIRTQRVLICGVGGVGGFALDALYRVGVSQITIIDKDVFDVTNQNRQIGSERVGESKVLVLQDLYKGIEALNLRVNEEFLASFDCMAYDYVLDCMDDLPIKASLAIKCQNLAYGKFISSMGSAKRLNPKYIQVGSVWKSHGDKFGRKFRDFLKKRHFKGNFKVVFSPETPHCIELGSFNAVTASFGLQIASEVVCDMIKDKRK
ncbi:tRNA threonylcarbamoyladenosine dehydratase [Helicobacter cetorum]|uniref:Molybdopterin biosynthesis protein n=1 Tax=Helicobacter cetorum (strain ATCC BAA-540 / CCUG 52418 / MIT 99-5656) TaxID=1163745 RepID=I0ETV7_HELCM|nr:tRNA threonylcarbamoyladenosine dehydratase [Helicobacter cetorum]AFI06376.1 molybdopterin biosynthesis protein [Helicobacter cetorum MIT 99-5656]